MCASSAPGAGYSWTASPAGFTAQGSSISTGPLTTSTTYYLNISRAGSPRTYSLQHTVYVVPQAGPNQYVTCGTTTALTTCGSSGSLPGATYRWSTPGAGPFPNSLNLQVSPTATTTYTLQVIFQGITYPGGQKTVYVVPITSGSQTIACGSSATLPTCVSVLPPSSSMVWTSNPNDPSLGVGNNATTLNPTVTPPGGPTPTTYTYTLTVLSQANNQVITTTSTTTVTVQACAPPMTCPPHTYAQGPDGTYSNPLGGPDHELGNSDPTQPVTRIDARGGRVVFEGLYHVVGPVEFVNGKFELTPGTVFYVEGGKGPSGSWPVVPQGQQCYADVLGGDHFIQLFVGQDATLVLDGATLTADCDEMWGGVELVDNGTLYTQTSAGSKQRARISEARVGVLLGTPCRSDGASYYLTSTDFYNDTYGVVALGNDHLMGTSCRVTDCHFSSDHTQRLWPDNSSTYGGGDYTQAGLVLRGAYHESIAYKNNTFDELLVGADVAGERVVFDSNELTACYGVGIRVGGPDMPAYVGNVSVRTNYVEVPDDPTPGGQVVPGADVVGISLPVLPKGGGEVLVAGNTVKGTGTPGNPRKPLIGLDAYLSFTYTGITDANELGNLDRGVRLFDAGGRYAAPVVSGNQLAECVHGVTLTGRQYAAFAPTVACNEFDGGDVGIFIEGGATVGDLGSAQAPNGNAFNVNQFSVENNSTRQIDYFAQFSPFENVTFNGTTVNVRRYSGNNCASRGSSYGLRGVANTLADVQQWQEQLLSNADAPSVLHALEPKVAAYFFEQNQLSDLESFVGQLAYNNEPAFERLSVYLMETYRQLGQDADAQRVLQYLSSHSGTNPEVAQRLIYFDLAGRLRRLAPGSRPSPADSTQLGVLAGTSTAYAPVACATLRFYYPSLSCGGNTAGAAGNAARAALTSANPGLTKARLNLRAYPNPAATELTVSADGTVPDGAHFELAEVSTGRVVPEQAAVLLEGGLKLTVGELAPGVYVGRLLHKGQLLGTCKVVVVR